MRHFSVAALLVSFVAAMSFIAPMPPIDAAHAQGRKKGETYCARYLGGAENCGFTSLQQCMQSISGSGGNCVAVQPAPRPKRLAPVTPMTPRDEDDTE
jgi:hypothetical protein